MIATSASAPGIRIRLVFAAAGGVLAAALLLSASFPWRAWGAEELLALAICTASVAFIAALYAHFARETWALYMVMAALVAWQALDTAAGLLALALGCALAGAVRWRRADALARTAFILSSWQLGAFGLALLLTAALYTALSGVTLFASLTFGTALALALAAVVMLAAALSLLALLADERLALARQLSRSMGGHLLRFVSVLIVILLAPLLLHQDGVVVFALVQALTALQLQRHARAGRNSQTLERRLRELTLLNNISQTGARSLVLDDVLAAVYENVSRLIRLRSLSVALHNQPQDTLDFRLVIVDGAVTQWPSRRADARCAAEQAISTGQPVHIPCADSEQQPAPEPNAAGLRCGAYLSLPLIAGSRALGALTLISAPDESFTPETISTLQTIASQTALTVRNTVLFAQRSELVDGLSYINDSVQNVLFNPNRDAALLAACQTALAITHANRAAIYLLQADGAALRLESSVGLSAAYQDRFRSIPFQPGLYAAGPRVIADALKHPDSAPAVAEGIAAYVEMPLLSTGEIRGLLTACHPVPHTYTLTELYLLETLANQITAMLENTQLIQLLELYAAEMAQLVDLSRLSTASMELETVVTNITHIIQDMAGASRVSLLLLDADGQRVRALSASGAEAGAEQRDLAVFPELLALVAGQQADRQVYHAGSAQLSAELAGQMRQHNEQTAALIPLRAAGALLGALLLGCADQRSFADREWQLLEMAANQIAAHLSNVQLYTQTRADLDQRLEQLSVAEELARQVSSSLDFNQIIGNMLDAALRATQSDAAAVALLTDADQFWVIEQRLEGGVSQRVVSAQPRAAGVMGKVVETGQPLRVTDNTAFPGYYTDTPDVYRSSLAVPLFSGAEVVGVLNVESTRRDFFTERQATFLASLAAHAVTSIDNARFLAEREQQISTLTSLRTLSLRLASADSTAAVAAAVLETGQAMLRAQCAIAYRCGPAASALTPLVDNCSVRCGTVAAYELTRAIALEAAHSRQLYAVQDVRSHPACAAAAPPPYVSAIAAPVEHHGQVTYVLFFSFADSYELQDRDRHAIELLAGQAAGHLENALLHEQIRAARDQMRAILDSTRAGMILLDTGFYLEAVNPAAERLLGISLEPYIGSYFPDALPHDMQTGYTRQQLADMALVLQQQPEITTRREFSHHLHNQQVYIEEVGSPVLDADGRIIGRLLVLQDITEARLLNEHREDLTRMVIHDLRGPLGAIINGVDGGLVALSTPPDAPDYAASIQDTRDLLRASYISANRLLRLVNSLLDVSRLESHQIELDKRPAALADIIATAYTALAASAQQAHIRIAAAVPPDLPPACADSDIIERVVINLLDNAVRYTPAGGEVRVSAQPDQPGMLRVSVADDGPGIPPQERAHIFKKFGRVQGSAPLRGARGLGLGLTFCQLAVEAHGGRIWVEDSAVSGSVFSFTLPLAAADCGPSA